MEWYFASSSAAFALSFVLQLKFHLYGYVAVGTRGPCAPCVLSFCCSAFCLSFLSHSLAPCTQKSISGQLHSWWPSQFPQVQGGNIICFCSKEPGKQIARTASCSVQKTSRSIQKLYKHSTVHHGVTHWASLSCVRHESCPSLTLQVCWMKTNPAVNPCIETSVRIVWIRANGPPAPGLPHPKQITTPQTKGKPHVYQLAKLLE